MKRTVLLSIAVLICATTAFATAPVVSSLSPSKNQLNISAAANITVTFDQPMSNTSITTGTVKVYGSFTGFHDGAISYGSNNFTFNPTSDFKPGEQVFVTVTTGVQNSGNEPMAQPVVYTFTVDAPSGYAKFKAPANYTVNASGSGNYATVIADLDGDGDLDVATTATLYNQLSVFMNNGNGTFATAVNYTTLAALDIKAADVDGDGDMDLVTANNNAHGVSVFVNSGGTFNTRNDFDFSPTQSTSGSVVVADMDGDGDIDIVASDTFYPNIHVLTNNGSGSFTSTAFPTTIKLNPLACGDIDKDGDMDIVGSNGTVDSVETFTNNGSGALTFTTRYYWTGSGYTAPIFADINSTFGDKVDLIYANASSNTITYFYDGLGPAFSSANTVAVGGYPDGIAAVDVDSDNDQDLLVANYNDATVSLLTNNGSGTFTNTHSYAVSSNPNDVRTADLNGDGTMDVVTSNNDGKISVLMNYNGGHVSSITPASGAINVDSTTNITIVFDENINSATLTAGTVKITGSLSGVHSWTLSSYTAGTFTAVVNPSTDFKPGEVVTVVVTAGVQNSNSIALEYGYSTSFRVTAGNTGGVFGAKTDYASGNQAQGVITVDLNADGMPDIAAVNTADNTISVLLNNGNGTYASAVTYSVGTAPTSIAAGDVDGDGDPDLVVATSGASSFDKLLNNGSGAFGTASSVSTSGNPVAIALGDIDGDGDLDAIYTDGSQLKTQKNDGTGSFSNEWGWSSASKQIMLTDVNHDGNLDVVTIYNNAAYVYRSGYNASYGWGYLATSNNYAVDATPTAVVAADFNGDGYADIVTSNLASGNGTINFLANNQNGTFASMVSYTVATGAQPRGVTALDVDGDGDLDLVVANGSADSAVVFTNNGSGVFTRAGQYATGDNPYAIAAADVDGDRDMDIVTANYSGGSISVLKNTKQVQISSFSPAKNAVNIAVSSNVVVTFNQEMNAGTLSTSTIKVFGSQHGPYSGTVGYNNGTHAATFDPSTNFKAGEDITVLVMTGVQNPDGAVLSAPYQWTFVAAASAEGTFGARTSYALYGNSSAGASVDMNGDGAPDVVTATSVWDNNTSQSYAQIEIALNNGSGVFGASDSTQVAGGYISGMQVTDVDGDGDFDVVLTTYDGEGGYFNVLLNDGAGNLTASALTFVGGSYRTTIGASDLDGDGDKDLVIVLSDLDRIKIYRNNGGTFSVTDSLSSGLAYPSGLVLTDINGDGMPDIATANYNSGNIAVFNNNGLGRFPAVTTVSSGLTTPDGIAAGDLNNDGAVDLAVSDWDGGKVAMLLNSGSGTFPSSTSYTNNSPSRIALEDMDGDGDLDVVTSEAGINKISVRANNGSGTLAAASLYSVGAYPDDFALVDVDGDGDLDIITANDNSTVGVIKNIELVKVNSSSPVANAINVAKNANITATFNVDINTATLVDSTVNVKGSVTGKIAGVITYDSPSKTVTFNPTSDFAAGEKITMTLTAYIKNTNGVTLHSATSVSFTVHADGVGNFAYHDSIPDLGQDASLYYYYANSIVTGDVTGDGKSDLLMAYNGRIKVFKNNTTSFDSIASVAISNTSNITLADLDNDGDLDMVQRNYSNNSMTVLLNDGSGNFTAQTPVSTGSNNVITPVLADIDNDGKVDAIFMGSGSQQVYIYYNDGTGTFSGSNYSWINTGDYAENKTSLQCADVNNDGVMDVVLHFSNKIKVILGAGDRTFATPVDYTISSNGRQLLLVDLNGDGALDLAYSNGSDNSFSIMLNAGNGTFGTATTFDVGYEVYQIESGDMDGDGDLDILVRAYDNNASIDKLVLAYNNGSGNFGNQMGFDFKSDTPTYYYSYSDLSLLDFDNDGTLDIAVHANHYYGSQQYENTLLFKNTTGSSSTPTVAATSITSSGVSGTSVTIHWTNGNGARHLVVMKQGSAVDGTPSDNSNFSPNAHFGSGTQLGTGNYVLYGGVGSSVAVTGLSKSTTYYVSVFEMNGIPGSEKVLTTSVPTASVTTTAFDGPFDATPGNALSYNNHWDQTNNSFNFNGAFTVELWVKPSSVVETGIVVHGSDYVEIGMTADSTFKGILYDDDLGDTLYVSGSTKISANKWYHLALTATNGDSLRLYVNGSLEGISGGANGTIGTLDPYNDVFYTGGDYNNSDYVGLIDELRYWSVARTASEIRGNMHRTFEGIPTDLAGYWQFNEGSGNSVVDHIGGNTFVPYDGSLTFVASDVPVGGGSNNNASVAANSTGLQTLGNVKLDMTNGFDEPTDVYVSEVSVAPSNFPTNYTSSVGNKYFIIDAFPYPDSGSFSATLTLSYGSGVLTDNNAASYILYKRASTSNGAWISYGSASSVNISTGDVTWTNIASFSQAIVVNQNDALPVELSTFTALAEEGRVRLNWKTATEVNNARFEIERSVIDQQKPSVNNWKNIGSVSGNGTSNTEHDYSFMDKSVAASSRYRLKQVDIDGQFRYSGILEVMVKVPLVFSMSQNYPNPFNPSTTLEFTIPKDGLTTLKIYNTLGQEVATLVNQELKAGEYHQAVFNGQNFASGVYFARLTSGANVQLKKMMLLK